MAWAECVLHRVPDTMWRNRKTKGLRWDPPLRRAGVEAEDDGLDTFASICDDSKQRSMGMQTLKAFTSNNLMQKMDGVTFVVL